MLDRLERIPRRWLLVAYAIGLVLLTAALGWIAYRAMFGSFDVPDDDGYVLMSLRKFYGGEALYTDVYSQYGPGIFVLVGGLLRGAGVALTNDGARDYNLFLWLGSTLLSGLAILRLTRRFSVAAVGTVLAFLVLKADANEPLHPGATIGFLLVAMVAAAVFLLPGRPRAALALLGALAAALFSVKVNVGVFALISVAFAAVATVPALRRVTPLRAAVTIAFVAIPFVLLSEHLGDADTMRFAVVVAAGAAGVALISTRLPTARVPDLGAVAWGVGGAVAVLVLVTVVPLLTGTSPKHLIEGWFLRPSETPGIQWVRLPVDQWMWVWAAACLGAAIATHTALAGSARGSAEPRPRVVFGIGRTLVGLLIWVSLAGPVFSLPIELTQPMVVGAPLLWVAMLDPRGASPENAFLRVLIPALAALQFLHAYPVPGSQLSWSSLLLVFVGAVCIADGIEEIGLAGLGSQFRGSFVRPDRTKEPRNAIGFRLWPALATIPVLVFGLWLCLKPLRGEARQARAVYNAGVELDLPGAREMRVPEPQALQLEQLTAGIQAHCETFMTLPGMNSLNIFAGQEPPAEL
ncbi:MAG TPA: hypothetical protein VFJ65_03305, partial [Solirubrobacterales bacterium]|nr:hypothetical protein [Solirubrobacterales bacterium]